jgi:hypothetical protein
MRIHSNNFINIVRQYIALTNSFYLTKTSTMKITSSFTCLFIILVFTPARQISAQAPDWIWAESFGSNVQMFDERGESVTFDAAGNVYTVGEFTGTVDFDQGPGTFNITSYGNFDVFISKLDAAGNFIWAQRLGGTANDYGSAITTDPTGNYIYITGSFGGTCDFDPGASSYNLTAGGGLDIFVCKLDISGNLSWSKQLMGSPTYYSFATGIITDNFGNVNTTGYFYGTVDFDPGNGNANLTSPGNSSDIFISKLDAAGNYIWAKQMGGAGDDQARSICIDHSGNGDIYTTGFYNATADFDPGNGTTNLTAVGQRDIFISRLDASGNFVWSGAMGGASSEWGNEITFDVAGNLWLTGGFNGTVDFDPGANVFNLISAGQDDIFIAKLGTTGNLLRASRSGGPSWDEGMSITADSLGGVYATGFFNGAVDFDPDSTASYDLTSIGDSDIFVTKMNLSGNLLWATSAGGTKGESGLSIAAYYNGDVYVSGYYRSSTVAFSGVTIANADIGGSLVSDAFVAKLGHSTGLENLSYTEGVSIYPNPSKGQFVVRNVATGKMDISIFNAMGEKIFSLETMDENTTVNGSLFAPGIYFVKVQSANGSAVKKLMID